MTMFEKPKVEITFSPHDEGDEPPFGPAATEQWADNTARRWALATLLTLLCLFTYIFPTFDGALLPGDDGTIHANSAFANSPGGLRTFWDAIPYAANCLKNIWGEPQRLPQFSPVAYTFILFEHMFFGLSPRGYHIVSILLHARNALFLWLLLRRLELPGAWLGAALFAVHPVQVDAVSWIAQQRYLICGLFYLCGLLVYLRRAGLNPAPAPPLPGAEPLIQIGLPENRTALYAFSMTLFVLALLSHVLAATFPLIVLVLIWWERGKLTRADIIPLIPFAAIGLGFAVAVSMLNHHRTGQFWLAFPGGGGVLAVWGRGVWSYFLAIILPISLSFAHPRWNADSIAVWQYLEFVAAIFVIVALWILRRRWGRGPITAALLFVCLLLPSALGASDPYDAELPGVMVRDHVLYLACCAVLIPLAALMSDALNNSKWLGKLAGWAGLLPIVSAVILVPLSIATAIHTSAYNDESSVWQNVLRGDGDSSIALNTLGQIELTAKKYSSAEQHFLSALRANPDDSLATMNLARLSENEKDFTAAIERYDEVLARHPDNVDAHFGLGEALSAQGDTKGALGEYAKVQAIDPHNALVHNNIGLIYAQLGELDESIKEYKRSIDIDPRSLPAYLNLANAQFQEQKFTDARDTLEKALHIDPQNYVAWLNAGVMAEAVGDLNSAESYFRMAIYYNFQSADAFNDLGMVLMRRGDSPGKTDRIGEAVYCFKRATELDPANALAAQNLTIAQKRKDAIIAQQQQ
jgi:tetratricopeptide (TPR) repeat protein